MVLRSASLLKSSGGLRSAQVLKRATPGEKVLGKLFPNRGTGFPGGWSSDRIQQVQHFVDWTYVAIHTICMKIASIQPNIAWVSDVKQPGRTVKAGARSLHNCLSLWDGKQPFGATTHLGSKLNFGKSAEPSGFHQGRWGQTEQGDGIDHLRVPTLDSMCGSSSSFLTVGEYRSKALSVVKPHEELEPVENNHLLRKLIDNPNPIDTHFDYRYELMMFKLLCGVAYEWVIPNSFGKPCERWVIPSHWVWPRTGGGDVVDADNPNADRLIAYYEVRPWGGMGSAGMLRLPPDQIITHLFKSPINKLDGYSKLWAISKWIDTEESISNSRWSQFINQARPEFWVSFGPGYNDPDDDMIARWEAKIAQKHQGEGNYGKPLFTPAGATVQTLSFSPTEMAYFQSEEQIRDMILSSFGVPKSAVGVVSDMTFGSVLATLMSFCEQCINPLLAQEGQVETKHLASRFDESRPAWSTLTGSGHGGSAASTSRRCKLWYDNCTPADPAQVNSDLTTDMQCHAITPSEVRVLRGRKPYAMGGDNPMVQGPGGLMPMPLNVPEDGEDLTDLIRQYTEAMAADKNTTKIGSMTSNEDIPVSERTGKPKDDGTGVDGGVPDPAGGAPGSVEDGAMNEGGQVAKPNSKPSKQLKTWQRRWTKKYGGHDHSSTQFNLADAGYFRSEGGVIDEVLALIARIDETDLAEKGREDVPHVTIRYGLETDESSHVKHLVELFGSVDLTLGYFDHFPGEEHDVVIIRADGERLHELNALLSELPHVQTHPKYQPHVTLAYVKPGLGQKWVDILEDESADQQGVPFAQPLNFTSLVFSPKEGTPTRIELAGFKWQEATGADSQREQVSGEKEVDVIPGGLADHADPASFDQEQLVAGTRIEMEHTSDPIIAREIAMDHLTEDPDHYVKLRRMEAEKAIIDEQAEYQYQKSMVEKYLQGAI